MTPEEAAAREARMRKAHQYRTVFLVNVDGREVLKDLEKQFAKAPDLRGTQEAMLKSYLRSAQRQMLDFIHMQIHIAEGGDPPDTPEAQTEGEP